MKTEPFTALVQLTVKQLREQCTNIAYFPIIRILTSGTRKKKNSLTPQRVRIFSAIDKRKIAGATSFSNQPDLPKQASRAFAQPLSREGQWAPSQAGGELYRYRPELLKPEVSPPDESAAAFIR